MLVSHKQCNSQTQNAKFMLSSNKYLFGVSSLIRYSIRSNPNVRVVHRIQHRIIATISSEIIEHHDQGEEGHTDDEGQHQPGHGCAASLGGWLHHGSPPPGKSYYSANHPDSGYHVIAVYVL